MLPPKPTESRYIYIARQDEYFLSKSEFNEWYDIVFKDAVDVECTRTLSDHPGAWYASENGTYPKTHTALLINIQPIKKESAEDILKDMIKEYSDIEKYIGPRGPFWDVFERAKAYLNGKA
jgi:hypothetical protein